MIDGDGFWHVLQGLVLGWAFIRISMLQKQVESLKHVVQCASCHEVMRAVRERGWSDDR